MCIRDRVGPVAGNISDCAAALEVISGHDPRDSTSMDRKDCDFTAALQDDVRGLRVGLPRDYFGEGLDPEVRKAVLEAAQTLREKGASVEEFDLGLVEYAMPAYYVIASAEASSKMCIRDRNGLSKKEKRDKAVNLCYVLPMLAIFLVFILYPITQVFYMSFFERKVNGDMIFVGLQNFADLFANPDTPRMFKNTFVWVFVGVAFKLILGLLMALILYKKFLGKKMMTAIMLIPYAMPAAVSCMIWRLMYNPMFGQITQFPVSDTHLVSRRSCRLQWGSCRCSGRRWA